MRQIVLDTETTGLRVEEGHRIIEIGCVEMIDRKLTGTHFHYYLNPMREIDAGAVAVHGITNEFLKDKPTFSAVVKDFMDFISDAELIIHNAPFDLAFINYELMLTRGGWKEVTHYCRVIDTLPMARQIHIGQRNSLDALCKRYSIDNSKRDLHGALMDAHLLAQVYLAMTGGQGSFFDLPPDNSITIAKTADTFTSAPIQKHNLIVLEANSDERLEHEGYLQSMKKRGKCLWLDDEHG